MTARSLSRLAAAALLLAASAAHAQLFRAYLASDGSDANPCTLASPCRLLPAALTAVVDGGQVWMLDSANYNTGTVTIGKSVSILAVPGAVGSFVAPNGSPAVSIPVAALRVSMRNVVIGPATGAGAGTIGVQMFAGSILDIEDSLIAGLPSGGVHVRAPGFLNVSRTTLRGNGGFAVRVEDGTRATIASSRIVDNNGGVIANASLQGTFTHATVSDSVISGGDYGVVALTIPSATVRVAVTRSTIDRAYRALWSETNGVGLTEVSVSGSMITFCTDAWYQAGVGSSLLSLGDNHMIGNVFSTGLKAPLPPQ
jgi:hypothetical protein